MVSRTVTIEAPAHSEAQAIDSVRHPVARRIADVLRNRSNKPRVFVIDDAENVEQAIASGIRLDSVYVTHSAASDLSTLLPVDDDVPKYILEDRVAGELFGDQKRPRVFALARAPRTPVLDDLRGTRGDLVVLDGVRLVGNIGAITRTACALGAAGLILLDSGLRTTLDRRLIRASRGLVFFLPIVLAERRECTEFLRHERISIATLSADAESPLRWLRSVADRVAIVLGSERDGVSHDLDQLANHRYSIPMTPGVESLNVSVTAGIALYEHGAGQEDRASMLARSWWACSARGPRVSPT
jgi:rRNA methylases